MGHTSEPVVKTENGLDRNPIVLVKNFFEVFLLAIHMTSLSFFFFFFFIFQSEIITYHHLTLA